ncbi:MAG: TetR family transcriptional regulator [Myxococcales bacterium]|nr:TetR family transcriptional regulator [Myxococcales bacterium]
MKKKARINPRKLPTQERSKQLVDSLLSATANILVRRGYEGLTTNRVADEAGVSVGSLYQYFPNKESLVEALIRRWSDGLMETIADHYLEVRNESIETAVDTMVRAALDSTRVDAKLHRILTQQIPNVNALPALELFNRRMSERVASWLELHREELEVEDLHLAAEIVVMTLAGLSDYALIQRPELLDSPSFVQHLSRLVLGYLAPTRASQLSASAGKRRRTSKRLAQS